MIDKFEPEKIYVYLGERHGGWNSEGNMDFCLDKKPHRCREVENFDNETKCYASFYDSPKPSYIWSWRYGFEDWYEFGLKEKLDKILKI